MTNRRMRLTLRQISGPALKVAIVAYLAASPALIILVSIVYFGTPTDSPAPTSVFAFTLAHAPVILGATQLLGIALIIILTRKCRDCRVGQGQRITSALDKMGKGDLGWKVTLRRGDELAEVAESVTRASESLADRIGKLQLQTRQLTEVESFLLDSLDADRAYNPYTIKALRKLKICTSRLHSGMEDFQISSMAATSGQTGSPRMESLREMLKA